MQSIRWYIQRLRAMSVWEIIRRARSSCQSATDLCLLSRRQRSRPLSRILRNGGDADTPGFRVTDAAVGEWDSGGPDGPANEWYERLLAKADRIAAHRLSFFDLQDRHLGDPIDWNRDHKLNKPSPLTFSASIDYRDVRVTGDCKFAWEPSRHHQLVALGRAYRASGDVRYAEAAVEQLRSWLDQCPFGTGMQWRSPLELGIRLINWVWTVDLIRESGLVAGEFRARLLDVVHRQVWEVARKYSHGSSANNHLIGEAAGVFVATSYFRDLQGIPRWRAESRRRLCQEIFAQTFSDGGGREQAIGYHLFVLQFFLIAGLVGRWSGEDFPAAYWDRLEKMFEFIGALGEGGPLPMFGDADDGYVLDLGGDPRDPRQWLAVAGVLFDRRDFNAWAGGCGESARWLLGRAGDQHLEAPALPEDDRPIASRAFPESGYYLLQSGRGPERISVVFDCGKLGLEPLAAHGHADALSFTLRAFGADILVDPGTYDYFSYPRWREYFRSTRAHNTAAIDGRDQSEMLGQFLWGARAEGRCICWEPGPAGGRVVGEHDGYARLRDPVHHRRTLRLDGGRRKLTILDEFAARDRHEIALYFHLSEHCDVTPLAANRYRVDVAGGTVTLETDRKLTVELLRASEDPIAGWVSRGYHRKAPAVTLACRCPAEGPASLAHRIEIGLPRG